MEKSDRFWVGGSRSLYLVRVGKLSYYPRGPPRQISDGPRVPRPIIPHSLFNLSSLLNTTLTYKQSTTHLTHIISVATMVAQTAAFKQAVEDSRKLKAKPNNDELLEVPAFPLLSCASVQ